MGTSYGDHIMHYCGYLLDLLKYWRHDWNGVIKGNKQSVPTISLTVLFSKNASLLHA